MRELQVQVETCLKEPSLRLTKLILDIEKYLKKI